MKYLIFLLAFFSCTYPCAPSGGMLIELIGFTQQQADTIILKKYEKGKGFTAQIDSLVIDNNVTQYRLSNDTMIITSTISTTHLLSKYDYLVRIPGTNADYFITDMNEPQQEGRKSTNNILCLNTIQSCKINGVLTQISFDRMYLKK